MYFTFFHYRRDSGLSKVLGSMTKLFSKNLHRSTDLLFLKSLVGSNNCIQHEKALLVSSTTLLFWLSLVVPIWKFSIKVSKMCIKPTTRLVRRQVPSSTCSYVYFRKYQKALYLSTHIDYGFVPKKAICVFHVMFSIYVFMVPNLLEHFLTCLFFLLFLSKEYMKPVTLT